MNSKSDSLSGLDLGFLSKDTLLSGFSLKNERLLELLL